MTVGPGQTYGTVAAAVAAANANDVINVMAGTYINDFPVLNVPLTINGIGGLAILQATEAIPNQKGIMLVNATATITNIEFLGANVTDADGGNGAGIRYQGGNLTIRDCVFQSNQDGVLANPVDGAVILIDHSTFTDNGSGTGYTHAVYVNSVASFTVQNSTFNGTKVGHDIKSRAVATTVTGNYLDDGVTGTTSYAIDIPNGGNALIANNQIVQGVNTQNPSMIEYGAEGEIYSNNALIVQGNTFTNSFPGQSVGIYNHTSDVTAQLSGNTFTTVTTPLIGPGVFAASPLFSAVLPGARSVLYGTTATAFATILNAGASALTGCSIALSGSVPPGLSMTYQPTDPTTNAIIGAAGTPVGIAGNGSQTFVLSFQSNIPVSVQSQPLAAACTGVAPAPLMTGVNTIDLIFSATPIPDIIALVATASGDGVLSVPFSQGRSGAFAVASDNVGAAGALTVTVDTGTTSTPIIATLCATNPVTAQCLLPPVASLAQNIATSATPTYSVFVAATGEIAFAPSTARIFVRFIDGNGVSHGSTSVAVRTN